MDKKRIILIAFGALVLVQLFVPAKMILESEGILTSGTAYRFKTAPIDPNDPFRGKYIDLSFTEDIFIVANTAEWESGDPIYVSLTNDSLGFAKIIAVAKEPPVDFPDYIKCKVRYVPGNGTDRITIDYPFDRYYMEESKAYDAELAYRESQRDNIKETWALVYVKNGNAVLKDVLIEGVPIKDIVNDK